MITVRPAAARGATRLDWLDSRHSFSFAEYFDPDHMGFGPLRVINDDRIAGGGGFGMHGHRDMEIVTWMIEGALRHGDSLGNGSVIRAGEVQRMSAGTGIRHSEINDSPAQSVHLLQIWIVPDTDGLQPGYEQTMVEAAAKRGRLAPVAGPPGTGAAVTIRQDATILATALEPGETARHALRPRRRAWVQVAQGGMAVNGTTLGPGDGAALEGESALDLAGVPGGGEALVFDLP
ncbi:MAG: pirin family protein [Alphaproteobacteria bacterium]|nr:pirin family protein [Alphaproteobacteria bacterium]